MSSVSYGHELLTVVEDRQQRMMCSADTVLNLSKLAARTIEAMQETPEAWKAAPLSDVAEIEKLLITVEQGALRLRRKHLGGTWLDKRIDGNG